MAGCGSIPFAFSGISLTEHLCQASVEYEGRWIYGSSEIENPDFESAESPYSSMDLPYVGRLPQAFSQEVMVATALAIYPCPVGDHECRPTAVELTAVGSTADATEIIYDCGRCRHVPPFVFEHACLRTLENLDRIDVAGIESLYEPTIDPESDLWEGGGGALVSDLVPSLTGRIDHALAAIDDALGGRYATDDDDGKDRDA